MVSIYRQLTPQIRPCGKLRPSITVLGMCGKGQGTFFTGCQKAERAVEEGDGESCKPFKHISSVTHFLRSAPPFTFPPTPIFHQIITLSVDSSVNEGRDLMVQTLPKISALVTSPSTQKPSKSFYIQTTRTMLYSNYGPEIRTHMYTT